MYGKIINACLSLPNYRANVGCAPRLMCSSDSCNFYQKPEMAQIWKFLTESAFSNIFHPAFLTLTVFLNVTTCALNRTKKLPRYPVNIDNMSESEGDSKN